ncbi:MAG: hypothetical protein OXF93_10715 [Acidobacteria bacterium]|nr:hypothetical protein [Acidobacteriota bacterium]
MRPAAGLEVLVMTAGMLAAPPPPAGGQPAGERGAPRTPMIEALAPGAFDDGNARAEAHVRYRVDATVRVPLLFGSVPLADRTDVGVASFRVRDLPDPAGEGTRTLRAYEFFAASDPARARGLNRLGFLREAAWIEDHVTRRTVQFGVVSSDRSGSRAEAERSLDGGDPSRTQMVSVVDTVIGPGATRSEVVRLSVGGLWQRAGDLYDEVRPRWEAEHPDDAGTVVNDPPRYDRPVGFLGALQASLRQAAKAVASGAGRAGAHHRYVHDNELYVLARRESRTDAKRGRRYRDEGLIGAGDEVHRLDYRIQTAPGGRKIESFRLWVVLPAPTAGAPEDGAPILPLAFEFRPRKYLELRARRIPPPAAPALSASASAPEQ